MKEYMVIKAKLEQARQAYATQARALYKAQDEECNTYLLFTEAKERGDSKKAGVYATRYTEAYNTVARLYEELDRLDEEIEGLKATLKAIITL